jgi:hypothetical protein
MGEGMRNGTLISGFENELALAFILGTGYGELRVIEGTVQYLFILDYPAARKQHSGGAKSQTSVLDPNTIFLSPEIPLKRFELLNCDGPDSSVKFL